MNVHSLHRSYHAPIVMPDVQLEFWARVYRANPALAARGVTFEAFLGAPFQYLAGTRSHQVAVDVRLKPEARAAIERLLLTSKEQRLERDALARADAVIDNGRRIEKLRHHRNRGTSAYRVIGDRG